jgi:hypothetical protein
MLSACMLDKMRATVEALTMDQTAEIQERPATDDGRGGELQGDWTTRATVACEVVRKQPRGEVNEAGQVVMIILYEVRLPHGTEIASTEQLVIAGQAYEILDYGDVHSRALQVILTCRKLN